MSPRAKKAAKRPPVLSRAAIIKAKNDALAAEFIALCWQRGLNIPVRECRFTQDRRWAFDFAWPYYLVAVEQEGGVWTMGRHSRGAGMVKDMEKYNRAAVLGWAVLRVTPDQLLSDETLALIGQALESRRGDAPRAEVTIQPVDP
ncbi:MAG TPA: hypothetical protein VN613_06005 [Gemmatimonadaceae bacterium]|nr:hypothetical protein [Gemmatimonadaceae bacterium]